jgi:hypothetical protein
MVKLGFDLLFDYLLFNCVIGCSESACCPLFWWTMSTQYDGVKGGVSFGLCTLSCVLYATSAFIHTARIRQSCQVYYNYLTGCYCDLVLLCCRDCTGRVALGVLIGSSSPAILVHVATLPRCEGRPGSPCPLKNNDRSVHLSQCNFMLCAACKNFRSPSTPTADKAQNAVPSVERPPHGRLSRKRIKMVCSLSLHRQFLTRSSMIC